MSRSVVMRGTERCDSCRFAPRWCICAGWREVVAPVKVEVLIHPREARRPTSTGHLIHRVMPASRLHEFSHEHPPERAELVDPGREFWVLHPYGETAPRSVDPGGLQVLLLDGSWREAGRMKKFVEPWGRLVKLPPSGPSRYRLRSQFADGMYSTAESLVILLEALGLGEAAERLRVQTELHVYAGLRSRGAILEAEEFLVRSPLVQALPEVVGDLRGGRRASEG